MKWDRKTRRYVTERGRVLHPSEIRKRVATYIEAEQEKVAQLSAEVIEGNLTLAKFFDKMEDLIRQWHTTSGVMAYGGEREMNRERWLRIDNKIEAELSFLQDFKQEMQAAEEVTDILASRSAMYAESTYATYENNVMAREFDNGVTMGRRISEEDDASCDECVDAASTYFSDLADIPEIGSLQCLTNCRCYIEYAEPVTGFTPADFPQALQDAIVATELPA